MSKFYTREFKISAVRLLESGERSMRQVARDLDIPVANLYRWRDEYARSSKPLFSNDNFKIIQQEVQKMKMEIEVLRQEREILKKAFGILSREH